MNKLHFVMALIALTTPISAYSSDIINVATIDIRPGPDGPLSPIITRQIQKVNTETGTVEALLTYDTQMPICLDCSFLDEYEGKLYIGGGDKYEVYDVESNTIEVIDRPNGIISTTFPWKGDDVIGENDDGTIRLGETSDGVSVTDNGVAVGSSNLIEKSSNGEIHIGQNSLVTVESGGVQKLSAADAAGNAINIDISNGSDLLVNGVSVMGRIDSAIGSLFGTSVALGQGSTASENAVAIGVGQRANGSGAVAIGDPNVATGTGAVAIGADNVANGNGAVAIGNQSSAIGQGSVALGNAASAGTNGVAVGNGASNGTSTNSVALGAGSANTANNQVAVGGRTVAGVSAGAVSETSTEAVNGSQLYVTNQAVAANTSAIAAFSGNLSGMQNQISSLFDLRNQDRKDMQQGVASAIAMAYAPMPSNPGGVGYAFNTAVFRGETAVGGSINYRLNTDTPTALSVGFSYAGNKNNGFRAGIAGEF